MTVLSGFELAGERLAVAFETRDQEEEHSCFSDTTHLDLMANVQGIDEVYRGARRRTEGPGMRELAMAVDPALASKLSLAVRDARRAVESIPAPFDRTIQAPDGSPERAAVHTAIEALEHLASLLAELGRALGLQIPMEP